MDEPTPGSVLRIEYDDGRLDAIAVRRRGGEKLWLVMNEIHVHNVPWSDLEGPHGRIAEVLYRAVIPEPPYDSHVLIIGQFGGVATYWHGIDGWHCAGTGDETYTWKEISFAARKIVVLAEKDTLKVNL